MSEAQETTILGEGVTEPSTVATTEEDSIAELVGEGKKYSTLEDAVKALAKKAKHADEFIEQLKTEKQELAESFEQTSTQLSEVTAKERKVDEILEALRQGKAATTAQADPSAAALTQDQLNDMLEKALTDRKTQEQVKANEKNSWELLDAQFGSRDEAKQAMAELVGSDPALLQTVTLLGQSNPDKLLKFVSANVKPVEQLSEGEGALNTGSFPDISGLTWEKAKKLKKDDPKAYWSPKFQRQLHVAADTNPDFYTK